MFITAQSMQNEMECHGAWCGWVVGCNHPTTHTKNLQVGMFLQQLYVSSTPLRMEVWWEDRIRMLAVPFRVFVEPVDQLLTNFSLRARLVVGYRIHGAHSAFRTPWGSGVHTAH